MRRGPSLFAVLLGAILALVPSVASGQRPYAWVVPAAEREATAAYPFEALIRNADELRLSASQLRRIESVTAGLVAQNEPLLAQIRDAEIIPPETDEERAALAGIRDAFVANAREADRQVSEILTPEQREGASNLIGQDSWAYPPTPTGGQAAEADTGGVTAERTTVVIENHNYYDANIYIVSGPRRQRLGFVGGLNTQTFNIPDVFVASPSGLRFEVRQIPSHRLPLTEEVMAAPGSTVFVRIPPG